MNAPRNAEATTDYEIVVHGQLGEHAAETLGARRCEVDGGGTRIVIGIIDQPHLHGVLEQLRDLNIEIERVNPV